MYRYTVSFDSKWSQKWYAHKVGYPNIPVFDSFGTKKYALINLSTDAGVAQLIQYLNRLGVDEALKAKGAKDGDTVRLQDFEFEYYE